MKVDLMYCSRKLWQWLWGPEHWVAQEFHEAENAQLWHGLPGSSFCSFQDSQKESQNKSHWKGPLKLSSCWQNTGQDLLHQDVRGCCVLTAGKSLGPSRTHNQKTWNIHIVLNKLIVMGFIIVNSKLINNRDAWNAAKCYWAGEPFTAGSS